MTTPRKRSECETSQWSMRSVLHLDAALELFGKQRLRSGHDDGLRPSIGNEPAVRMETIQRHRTARKCLRAGLHISPTQPGIANDRAARKQNPSLDGVCGEAGNQRGAGN